MNYMVPCEPLGTVDPDTRGPWVWVEALMSRISWPEPGCSHEEMRHTTPLSGDDWWDSAIPSQQDAMYCLLHFLKTETEAGASETSLWLTPSQ